MTYQSVRPVCTWTDRPDHITRPFWENLSSLLSVDSPTPTTERRAPLLGGFLFTDPKLKDRLCNLTPCYLRKIHPGPFEEIRFQSENFLWYNSTFIDRSPNYSQKCRPLSKTLSPYSLFQLFYDTPPSSPVNVTKPCVHSVWSLGNLVSLYPIPQSSKKVTPNAFPVEKTTK